MSRRILGRLGEAQAAGRVLHFELELRLSPSFATCEEPVSPTANAVPRIMRPKRKVTVVVKVAPYRYFSPDEGRPSVTRIHASSKIADASRCPAIKTSTAAFSAVSCSVAAESRAVA